MLTLAHLRIQLNTLGAWRVLPHRYTTSESVGWLQLAGRSFGVFAARRLRGPGRRRRSLALGKQGAVVGFAAGLPPCALASIRRPGCGDRCGGGGRAGITEPELGLKAPESGSVVLSLGYVNSALCSVRGEKGCSGRGGGRRSVGHCVVGEMGYRCDLGKQVCVLCVADRPAEGECRALYPA